MRMYVQNRCQITMVVRQCYLLGMSLLFVGCGVDDYRADLENERSAQMASDFEEATPEAFFTTSQQKDASEEFQKAIVKVAGAHFQSCAPLLKPDKRPIKIVRKLFEDEASHTDPKMCLDRRSSNVDYISFGKGSLEPDAGWLELKGGEVNSFQRYHCSGFVAATMAAGGHKYYRSQKSKDYSPRTFEIVKDFNRKDSCFFKPKLTKKVSLLPGDIINIGHGHVIRVLTVGSDPLGLSKVRKKKDCKKISKNNLDFTFAHSTSSKGIDGGTGVRVEHAKNATTSLVAKLSQLTKKMCLDKFKDGKVGGRISDTQYGTKKIGIWPFETEEKVWFGLRRHVGSSDPECSYDPLPVRGEDCLSNSCYEKVRSL